MPFSVQIAKFQPLLLQKVTAAFHLSKLRLTTKVSLSNFNGSFLFVALGNTD